MRTVIHHLALLALLLPAALFTSLPARAALIVSAQTVNVAPGASGFVEVSLTNTFATPQTLSAFSLDIALGGAGVSFTNVSDQTTSPYVFGALGTGVLSFDAFPNTQFIASDISLAPAGFVTLNPGSTFGLARIGFAVDPGAGSGLRAITFVPGLATQFADDSNTALASTALAFTAGGINVQGAAQPVPEPSSMAIFLVGAASCAAARRLRTNHPRFSTPLI